MNQEDIIKNIIAVAETLIPFYMENEIDRQIANGNVAICIIDADGVVHGKMFGTNKPRARESFKVAWIKASQVYLTGMKTSVFEQLAFNGALDETIYGIERPDYIGWVGGQPISLASGEILSVGFSGFRGEVDLEIVIKALAQVNQEQ